MTKKNCRYFCSDCGKEVTETTGYTSNSGYAYCEEHKPEESRIIHTVKFLKELSGELNELFSKL